MNTKTNGIEKAVSIAIENGGYKAPRGEFIYKENSGWWYEWEYEDYDTGEKRKNSNPCCYDHPQGQRELVLDPLFWQALERHFKWTETTYDYERHKQTDWKWHWHRFIDHLASGKDIESYFTNLLTNH